ncbi:MAG: hypothetical protein IPP07_10540 [Holophagales bacterium]|nr:hypothetical protein [Holophagales bacterium]
MKLHRKRAECLAIAVSLLLSAGTATAADTPLKSWSAKLPSVETPQLTDAAGYVMSFMPVTPCRIIDTRGGAPFTGGAFAAATGRDYQFSSAAAPCNGLPAGARGYSINVTVTNTAGAGFLAIYPRGGQPVPLVSTINYVAGQSLANAASVPTDSSGFLTILCGAAGTDVIVDVNGYYIGTNGSTPLNPGVYAGWSGNTTAGGILYVKNDNTTSTDSTVSGIRGIIVTTQSPGMAGVWGQAVGGSGANYGVKGTNPATYYDSAAVIGFSGAALPPRVADLSAGVRGEASGTAYGVLGHSAYAGVAGAKIGTGGGTMAIGRLGYLTYGVFSEGDMGGTGAKYFVEPHPEEPTQVIRYVALEGPESGTYFRGRSRFVNGSARIAVPDSFRFVTDPEGITVQVTPIGRQATFAVTSIDLKEIVVEASKDVEFSFLVQGVRKAFKGFEPIGEGMEFVPEGPRSTMPASLTQEARRRLVANGTYNPDGTVNLTTAERAGWAQAWRERDEAALEAAAAAAEAAKADPQISGSRSPVREHP